jgi:hypothetical protein
MIRNTFILIEILLQQLPLSVELFAIVQKRDGRIPTHAKIISVYEMTEKRAENYSSNMGKSGLSL